MKLVIQRVIHASFSVDDVLKGSINKGLVVFAGFGKNDTESIIEPAVRKLVKLRIFADCKNKMNLDIMDIAGELMIISQFTLYADTHHGNRPDFLFAMEPAVAENLFNRFVDICHGFYPGKIVAGDFGRHMVVKILNDGPVTILLNFGNGTEI
ncbi:MAG TPA: D-aminoacyl-tRNA deacylase [bacterium]|nr:D-aminoacyl-tRNA deacylase [bacterium]